MIKIQKLIRVGKKSGFELPAGETTEIRGMTITNTNKYSVYVDKWTRARKKK